ncbi:hypothetical protein IW261DRAFT_186899 [Armillaria novae-zelandiae]|uniref:Reverse transcriptase domain-containing protein n=1 Tax=Armillaria novae-zelandiae TaxID=153914 RepID=A0AA39P717_9AGAR|nr:hypothetical protein IW261DRAFT_186899 [Armillaria novae-zelandiae]
MWQSKETRAVPRQHIEPGKGWTQSGRPSPDWIRIMPPEDDRTLDRHVRLWMEDNHILPDSQNSFHAMNNPSILRTAIGKALGEGGTLYVAFTDLNNAFPSMGPSLWSMMYKEGVFSTPQSRSVGIQAESRHVSSAPP